MNRLSKLEFVILKLLKKANGKANWYLLEITLSNMDNIPRTPSLRECLEKLEELGLVFRYYSSESRERWSLTEAGLSRLSNIESCDIDD